MMDMSSTETNRDSDQAIELSIVIPALNEADNLRELLPELEKTLARLVRGFEIIIVDHDSVDGTAEVASDLGAIVHKQERPGYGGALEKGFRSATGQYVLTMDADLSHRPAFVPEIWARRHEADVIVASRYTGKGNSEAGWHRRALSRSLNAVLSWLLDIGITDLSSGFRMYRAPVVRNLDIGERNFASLVEILVRAYADGRTVMEIPFHYEERKHGNTHAQLISFGFGFMATAYRMWKLRNSILCADYDARAYNSRIPLQRYWQRRRYALIKQLYPYGALTLDIGCGSSRILTALNRSVGLDVQINKLRYSRVYRKPLVNGSVFQLPFRTDTFDCVICSQVIEHLVAGAEPFEEMLRVLKPEGTLILGTPDYGRIFWPLIEKAYKLAAPGAYADEHITHYTAEMLTELLEQQHNLTVEATRWIMASELIVRARRPQQRDQEVYE